MSEHTCRIKPWGRPVQWLCGLIAMLICADAGQAGPIHGQYHLDVVFDSAFEVDDPEGLSAGNGGTISASGSADFSARAFWTASNATFGVLAEAEGRAGWLFSPSAKSTVTTSWTDRFQLVATGAGTVPLPNSLEFQYRIDAQLEATTLDRNAWHLAVGQTVFANGSLTGRVNGVPFSAGVSVPHNQRNDSESYSALLTVSSLLDSSGFGDLSATISAQANTSYGRVTINAGHTMELVSILMPDGSTPEENGFQLVFDSGMESPNLLNTSAVPEPSSLALLGSGALGLIGFGVRRRKVGTPPVNVPS